MNKPQAAQADGWREDVRRGVFEAFDHLQNVVAKVDAAREVIMTCSDPVTGGEIPAWCAGKVLDQLMSAAQDEAEGIRYALEKIKFQTDPTDLPF